MPLPVFTPFKSAADAQGFRNCLQWSIWPHEMFSSSCNHADDVAQIIDGDETTTTTTTRLEKGRRRRDKTRKRIGTLLRMTTLLRLHARRSQQRNQSRLRKLPNRMGWSGDKGDSLMSFLIVDSVFRLHAYLLLRGTMYLYSVQCLHLCVGY